METSGKISLSLRERAGVRGLVEYRCVKPFALGLAGRVFAERHAPAWQSTRIDA